MKILIRKKWYLAIGTLTFIFGLISLNNEKMVYSSGRLIVNQYISNHPLSGDIETPSIQNISIRNGTKQDPVNRSIMTINKPQRKFRHECFPTDLNFKNVSDYIDFLKSRVLKPRVITKNKKPKQNDIPADKSTTFNFDKTLLLQKLGYVWQWTFVRKRIDSNWDTLVQATKDLVKKDLIPEKSTKRRVLVFPGVIEVTNYAKSFAQGRVAPVGELVQWSDLIAGLYILGHDVELHYDKKGAANVITRTNNEKNQPTSKLGCGGDNAYYDYIYTDLLGHEIVSRNIRVKEDYKHKFRILDFFGTEQAYNNVNYIRKRHLKGGDYGGRDLYLKQFYTNYPQTPDNTFLGCIVYDPPAENQVKKHIAYLYGKQPEILRGRIEPSQIMPVLQKHIEVHSSLKSIPSVLAPYKLINHGYMNAEAYHKLAEQAKVVVGLGTPEAGPGLLEALAKGCVLVIPAKLKGCKKPSKPTNRTFTSQNVYAEKYIGPPYVYTVDYNNKELLEEVIKVAIKTEVKPFIPFELTPGGYLQRLYTLLEHQNWCTVNKTMWPPLSSMKVILGDSSRSCNEVCEDEGLYCENLHFPVINNKQYFTNQNIDCKTEVFRDELYAPSYFPETSTCVFQKDKDLYSCASYNGPKPYIRRLCPCRDFIQYQVHMCKNC